MAAKFELFKGKTGDFRFHLKAANGEIIRDSLVEQLVDAPAVFGVRSVSSPIMKRIATSRRSSACPSGPRRTVRPSLRQRKSIYPRPM